MPDEPECTCPRHEEVVTPEERLRFFDEVDRLSRANGFSSLVEVVSYAVECRKNFGHPANDAKPAESWVCGCLSQLYNLTPTGPHCFFCGERATQWIEEG